ncbi:MAG: HD domain-containing protein [Bacilli bacterium]|nr:HD domain-containing protein [Bacilli bacterium]
MDELIKIFKDDIYPEFIDKYLNTKTLDRIKYVSQFCGCDYTNLYNTKFYYSRYDHSLVVAHMTWHFTHDKNATIAALLHDVGTPCFAHSIDYVFGDYINQESSEKDIIEIIKKDEELLQYLNEDNIFLKDLQDLTKYPILENKTPKLCTDRLDGVLGTCYIWLQTHSLDELKEIYDNLTILENDEGIPELGFKDIDICQKFVDMILVYAKELQGNTDKYTMKYISEVIKIAVERNLITLEDLYTLKESEIISILFYNFDTWNIFENATELIRTNEEPENFYASFNTKKRNVIPLVINENKVDRIIDISSEIKIKYDEFNNYKDTNYAYLKRIKKI